MCVLFFTNRCLPGGVWDFSPSTLVFQLLFQKHPPATLNASLGPSKWHRCQLLGSSLGFWWSETQIHDVHDVSTATHPVTCATLLELQESSRVMKQRWETLCNYTDYTLQNTWICSSGLWCIFQDCILFSCFPLILYGCNNLCSLYSSLTLSVLSVLDGNWIWRSTASTSTFHSSCQRSNPCSQQLTLVALLPGRLDKVYCWRSIFCLNFWLFPLQTTSIRHDSMTFLKANWSKVGSSNSCEGL